MRIDFMVRIQVGEFAFIPFKLDWDFHTATGGVTVLGVALREGAFIRSLFSAQRWYGTQIIPHITEIYLAYFRVWAVKV